MNQGLTYKPFRTTVDGGTVKQYTFLESSGHGWLAVPHADLLTLGIEGEITPYSYIGIELVYLEEDLDLSTFLDAAKSAGWRVEYANNWIGNDYPAGYGYEARRLQESA